MTDAPAPSAPSTPRHLWIVGILAILWNAMGAWNYIARHLETPVLPGSRYRLSCWLKVDELEPVRMVPYLKLGVTDGDGKWLENFHTSRYDMNEAGTWQRLEATFDTPLETAGGHLALERGGKDVESRIEAWIDDVQLELLEAP